MRTRPRLPGAPRADAGVVIPLVAMALLSIVIVTALVVDFGFVRSERRDSQKVVDLAALAGGNHLSSATEQADPPLACTTSLSYLHANLGSLPEDTELPCSNLPAVCDSSTVPVTITDGGTADPYQLRVTYPVPDADINDDRVDGGLRLEDGQPCERMAFELVRTHPGFFSSYFTDDGLTVRASAVVRRIPMESNRVPSLWLLEPFTCQTLTSQGGSSVTVGTDTRSGLINADSDGTGPGCSSTQTVIDTGGQGSIRAIPDDWTPPSEISLVAMATGQVDCTGPVVTACIQSQVDTKAIDPPPTPRRYRATRSLVDHVYNCRADYPDYPSRRPNGSLTGASIPINGCPDAGSTPAAIDELSAFVGTTGPPASGTWNRFTTQAGVPCNVPNNTVLMLQGNWWIDCPPPNGLSVGNGSVLRFTGGNLVFDGPIRINSGIITVNGDFNPFIADVIVRTSNPRVTLEGATGCSPWTSMCFEQSARDAAWVYQRRGGFLQQNNGGLLMNAATLVQAPESGNVLRISGGAADWSAPRTGVLQGLSLWSEAVSSGYTMVGGGDVALQGVFFTPEANPFNLQGQAEQNPQEAQFISRRLTVAGGGQVNLAPMGTDLITIPPPAAYLIR